MEIGKTGGIPMIKTDMTILSVARWVKLADLRHNSDLSRFPESERATPQTLARFATYRKALAILEERQQNSE